MEGKKGGNLAGISLGDLTVQHIKEAAAQRLHQSLSTGKVVTSAYSKQLKKLARKRTFQDVFSGVRVAEFAIPSDVGLNDAVRAVRIGLATDETQKTLEATGLGMENASPLMLVLATLKKLDKLVRIHAGAGVRGQGGNRVEGGQGAGAPVGQPSSVQEQLMEFEEFRSLRQEYRQVYLDLLGGSGLEVVPKLHQRASNCLQLIFRFSQLCQMCYPRHSGDHALYIKQLLDNFLNKFFGALLQGKRFNDHKVYKWLKLCGVGGGAPSVPGDAKANPATSPRVNAAVCKETGTPVPDEEVSVDGESYEGGGPAGSDTGLVPSAPNSTEVRTSAGTVSEGHELEDGVGVDEDNETQGLVPSTPNSNEARVPGGDLSDTEDEEETEATRDKENTTGVPELPGEKAKTGLVNDAAAALAFVETCLSDEELGGALALLDPDLAAAYITELKSITLPEPLHKMAGSGTLLAVVNSLDRVADPRQAARLVAGLFYIAFDWAVSECKGHPGCKVVYKYHDDHLLDALDVRTGPVVDVQLSNGQTGVVHAKVLPDSLPSRIQLPPKDYKRIPRVTSKDGLGPSAESGSAHRWHRLHNFSCSVGLRMVLGEAGGVFEFMERTNPYVLDIATDLFEFTAPDIVLNVLFGDNNVDGAPDCGPFESLMVETLAEIKGVPTWQQECRLRLNWEALVARADTGLALKLEDYLETYLTDDDDDDEIVGNEGELHSDNEEEK